GARSALRAMIIYACSSNPGKLREFALAASRPGNDRITIEPLPGLRNIAPPEEHGSTFEENAAAKAVYYSEFTDGLVFADDSGFEVEALNGAPGVYSARYAGPQATDEENNRLVLQRTAHPQDRRARFVCVLALARSGKLLASLRGSVEGEILHVPRGQNGFGYDPLFFIPPLSRSFAELTAEEKFAVSHRGHALRAMAAWLRAHPAAFV
ncbi:MAG: RdgB/HAM1 family non-canonical purine NTP pyrophosphatase, partial [Bryobacteraceae bacterium]